MTAQPKACGYSHIGHRDENQDRFKIFDDWARDGSFLAIVADGMGGQSGGTLAAQTVIATAQKLWPTRHLYPNPKTFLQDLANLAQNAVIAAGQRNGQEPRTTVAALYIKANEAVSMHIGDSRIIKYSRNRFVKRTQDHSLAEIQFQRGKITEADIAKHPDQNKLTKCLGQPESADPEFEEWEITRNNTFIVCSDGFWSLWDKKALGGFAHQIQSTPDLQDHIKNGLENCTGHDNTTAIVIQMNGSGFSLPSGDGGFIEQLRNPYIGFSIFGLIAFAGIFALLDPLLNNQQNIIRKPTIIRNDPNFAPNIEPQNWNPEEFFANTPAGATPPAATTLPDFEAAISETEQMLENLARPSWNAATNVEKQKQEAKKQAVAMAAAKRNINGKPIWEPMDAPYENARSAAKTVTTHLQRIGILSPNDTLRATAIDTVSTLDPTPVRVEFTQTHKEIPVLNSRIWVDIEEGRMVQIGGRPASHILIEAKPKLTFEQAANQAKTLGIDQLGLNGREKLVIFRGKHSDHLGWMLEGEKNGQTETLIISAEDGSELFSQRTVSTSKNKTVF